MNTPVKSNSAITQSVDKESQLTLELLRTIEDNDDVSQRHLAQQMGVALGLANSYLKRCVKKGWIKVSTAPANRYLYYLTPNGFAEKARLTAEFFTTSFALFRQAGNEYTTLLQGLSGQEKPRLLFIGLSDLTEIALMRAQQSNLSVVGIYQPNKGMADQGIENTESGTQQQEDFFGVPVLSRLLGDCQFDVAILTSMEQTIELLAEVEKVIAANKIKAPQMLLTMKFRSAELESDENNANEEGATS